MAASTPDEVVRETEFVSVVSEMSVGDEDMHEEARTQVSSLLESGKTKDACASLAANMIKTVNDNAKNIQKALDAMDMGKNCAQAGLKAYTDAQTAEGKAKKKNDDAVKAKSKAAKKAHEDAKLACACKAQRTHKSGVDMSKKVKS